MAAKVQTTKRKDSNRVVLQKGESQRKDGSYDFRWTTPDGKRHSIYAPTLEELRQRESEIKLDQLEGIKAEAQQLTVNDLFKMWIELKRGLKDNTFQNYQYMYRMFVLPSFGKLKIRNIVKSDVKRFYNTLVDERGLQASTVDSVHTVLHQLFNLAVDDNYIRGNPTDNVLRELKKSHVFQTEKRRALTKPEQDLFLDYLRRTPEYTHWYPVFAVMLGTGLRVGEAVGLRWCDIDLDDGIIDVNHTLVYYKHAINGCYFNIHTPKTPSSIRQVPMLGFVKAAFLEERQNQAETGQKCTVSIDGYTDFIFINRNGATQHQGTLNKAIRRIVRDCNDAQLLSNEEDPLLLPHFSCHSLRHSFATRMCEAGVNVKVIQDTLGHADISTTMNIYADATRDLKDREFQGLDKFMGINN